jgi:serine/threonine-protein kinase RIO1
LLSEYIDAPQAWDVFEGENFNEQEKRVWAKNLYNLFVLLKRSQISHGDLKAQNILCPPRGALFIDLDGMKASQSFQDFYRQFKKDIQRFERSWPENVEKNTYFEEYSQALIKPN